MHGLLLRAPRTDGSDECFTSAPGNAPITSGSDFVGGGTGQARYLIGTNLRASSSTSVTVAFEGGVTFDNGKVEVYGLK